MSSLLTICNNFKKSTEATNISESVFDEHFNELMNALSKIINKHAPIQKASRKQRRFLQKPWLTKGLLISIKNNQNYIEFIFYVALIQKNYFTRSMQINSLG